MAKLRNPGETRRRSSVLPSFIPLCCALLLVVGAARPAPAADEPEPADVARALFVVGRTEAPLAERLEAAAVLLSASSLEDPEAVLRAAAFLLEAAPEPGAWLVLRARDAGWIAPAPLAAARARVSELLLAQAAPATSRSAWAAAGLALGAREDSVLDALLAPWPPGPLAVAVLRREGAAPEGSDAAAREDVLAALGASREVALLLDRADQDDPAASFEALDALVAAGERAPAVLLREVERAATGLEPGRVGRATRAVLALGATGRREATPALAAALDAPEGWVQVAAATALGDLGDPAAAPALCRKILYRGDVLRPRDEWDVPAGSGMSPEAWAATDYYVVDVACADALLRLGARGAAGWLIEQKLNPTRANFRVRVLQDAHDALARALPPQAPVADYAVDAGFPARRVAALALSRWWLRHRDRADVFPGPRFDEEDAGFRLAAREVAEHLRGRSVLDLQIAHETCEVLGPAMTPTLTETLDATTHRVHRAEITRALGMVRDPRAIPVLLRLLAEPSPLVRSLAAEALGAYVEDGRALDALLALLADPEPGPRVGARKALVRAAPDARVREALRARRAATEDDRDARLAEAVALLVQEGEGHWAAVRASLRHEERYVRRQAWDLLRAALDLPLGMHDAGPGPGEAGFEEPPEAAILAALGERRGA